MPNAVFNSFKRDIMNGSIDLDTDIINVMLVTSTYVPNIDLHTKRSDITNEVVGTGYTAGGQALAGKVVSAENASDAGKFTATNTTWAASTITARGAVLYKARGGLATADEVIAYIDFVTDKTSSAGDFTVQWNANGILTLA